MPYDCNRLAQEVMSMAMLLPVQTTRSCIGNTLLFEP